MMPDESELVNRPQPFNSCLAATDTAVLILGIHHKEQHKNLQGKKKNSATGGQETQAAH